MASTEPAGAVEEGLERAVEASRELAADAIRLARLELTEAIRAAVRSAALFGASALLLALAWIGGAVALALFLVRVTEPVTAVALVAAGHAALALGCALVARRSLAAEGRS